MGRVVEKIACTSPTCNSSDGLVVYLQDDGKHNATCFSCGHYDPDPYKQNAVISDEALQCATGVDSGEGTQAKARKKIARPANQELRTCLNAPILSLEDRGISYDTAAYFNVRSGISEYDGKTPVSHLYPVYRKDKLTGYKERNIENKTFHTISDTKHPQFFGQNKAPVSKRIYITEGECDAMILFQCLKERQSFQYKDVNPAVISLPFGNTSVNSSFSDNIEFLDQYEEIVLVFDEDLPGEEAVEEAVKFLPHKTFIAKLGYKDPNEMYDAGRGEDLKWAVIKHARPFEPDDIVNGADTWDRFLNTHNEECYSYPETWTELNGMTCGYRLGSLVTVTSGTGCGKTQLLRELKHHIFESTNFHIADIALEEDLGDTVGGLMAIRLNKRIFLPEIKKTLSEEELRSAHNHYFKGGRFTFYDYFGGMDNNNLFSKIRYCAGKGAKVVFLDHLSIIVSEFADQGGERERIDTIMTKLAKLVKELNIVIFLVVHLKKSDNSQSFEEGKDPSLDDLRGSGSLKQLSWDVISLTRNQQHPDKYCSNTSKIKVLKCRFTGRTGDADYLYFDDTTGRMMKVPKPSDFEVQEKKNGFSR